MPVEPLNELKIEQGPTFLSQAEVAPAPMLPQGPISLHADVKVLVINLGANALGSGSKEVAAPSSKGNKVVKKAAPKKLDDPFVSYPPETPPDMLK